MKTLVVTILSNLFFGLNAQTIIVAKEPVIVKAPIKYTWQVNVVLPLTDGNLLIGQNRNMQSDSDPKTILLQTNKNGEILKKNELPFPSAIAACLQPDGAIIFLNSTKEKAYLTKIANAETNTPLWQVGLPRPKGGALASLANGQIALAIDTENFIKVKFFNTEGKFLKDILLKKEVKSIWHKSKIIALNDGTWAVIGGGIIWGLADNGEIIWQYGSETEKMNWQNIKQLTNGEIIAIGAGKSEIFDLTSDDIQVWSIAKDGTKINWTSIIGEDGSNEVGYDLVESPNNELMILATKDSQVQLIKLDHEHQPTIAYSQNESNKNTKLRFLITNQSNNWLAIGNTYNGYGREIIVQGFGQRVVQKDTQKSVIHLLSIGINGQTLQYAKHDAETINELYKNQVGLAFKAVQAETLTADSSTKAGELAKKFELLSSKQDLQENDLLLVYFSGNGMKVDDDYLLMGSDFDPAALRSTSVKFSQLIKYLDNLPCRKLIVLDACYSGFATQLNLPKNISILTSSTAEQVSFEDPNWQHGALTKVMVEAFRNPAADTNQDQYITLNELFDFIKKRLPILTQNKRLQTPLLLHKGDDFVVFEK